MAQLDERLKNVAVIGAAGKMGSGIALLLLQEMARATAEKYGSITFETCQLTLIDANSEGLSKLKAYLRSNLLKYAEKNINALRRYYEKDVSLVSNEEIIQAFLQSALDSLIMGTDIALAKNAQLVFEAIVEDFKIKVDLFQTLRQISPLDQWYFTNTSSIPINLLGASADIESRLIGFHFYNPPAVQKLLEIVMPRSVDPALATAALELAKRMQKIFVLSHDIAGFIGNGYFMREIIFSLKEAKQLAEEYKISFAEAIVIISIITQKYLLRPMGIFQLIDYVGIDVCYNIMQTMAKFLPNDAEEFSQLNYSILDQMLQAGIKGGHFPDGTQKNGFFSYKNNEIQKVCSFDLEVPGSYVPLPSTQKIESLLGEFSAKISWKSLQQDKNSKKKIQQYLDDLPQMNTVGSRLSETFLSHSRKVIDQLVSLGVAEKPEDVATVLKQGFFHLYT